MKEHPVGTYHRTHAYFSSSAHVLDFSCRPGWLCAHATRYIQRMSCMFVKRTTRKNPGPCAIRRDEAKEAHLSSKSTCNLSQQHTFSAHSRYLGFTMNLALKSLHFPSCSSACCLLQLENTAECSCRLEHQTMKKSPRPVLPFLPVEGPFRVCSCRSSTAPPCGIQPSASWS